MLRLTFPCLLLLMAAPVSAADVQLYVLDCGHARLADGSAATDSGALDGKPVELADPCFLIRHPRGVLLWDLGLAPDIKSAPGFDVAPGAPLPEQLASLGLRPDDVTFIAFSHLHFDHAGNAALFPRATWILNTAELAWAEHTPPHVSMQPQLFAGYRQARVQRIDGDDDVFGDGRVRIVSAPGHTPGSAVLWVGLSSGPVVLSGDLWVSRRSRAERWVPRVNADRAATLSSMARIERLVRRTHARVIVQHDPEDYAALPKLPQFLE